VEIAMIVQFARWGNSIAVRIPGAFAREIAAECGASADLTIENGALVIRPVDAVPVYKLNELLDGMSHEHLHGETDTGAAVGNEFA